MRLDDARSAAEAFDEVGITAVLHGHRHVSEQRQPAGSNFVILASPSLTLGGTRRVPLPKWAPANLPPLIHRPNRDIDKGSSGKGPSLV